MPSHNAKVEQFTLESGVYSLFFFVQTSSSGTVIALQQFNRQSKTYAAAPGAGNGYGIKSVTRTGTGLWTVVLDQPYQRLLQVNAFAASTTGLAAAIAVGVVSGTTNIAAGPLSGSSPQVGLQFLSATGTAQDPGATTNELVGVQFTLQFSSAP